MINKDYNDIGLNLQAHNANETINELIDWQLYKLLTQMKRILCIVTRFYICMGALSQFLGAPAKKSAISGLGLILCLMD